VSSQQLTIVEIPVPLGGLQMNQLIGSDARPDSPYKQEALNKLFSLTYEELRRIASSAIRRDPTATMNPTALVNETWIKFSNSPHFQPASKVEFKRVAAQAMRQVLVDAARRRHAQKRGGLAPFEIVVPGYSDQTQPFAEDLLALDQALDELAALEPRQAAMIESRFFGGLDVSELAELLHVSEATVKRDWRVAKAWLKHKLRQNR
jgi:RNA polymerase sigma factor (TIGR02999 family)